MEALTAARELATLLKAEIHALGEFLELLLREQDTLVRGARDRIGAEVAEKARVLQELTRHTRRRGEILQTQNCAPTRAGMESWLSRGDSSEALSLWHTLLRHTQRAFQLNHTNGVLIESGLRANQSALAVLCSAVNLGHVYGHNGRPQTQFATRRWGTA
jgi:flagellar biosynthesis/type III secretory pathway chaperone